MSDDRSIRVRLYAQIQQYQQGLKQAAQSTAEFGRNVSGMGKASSVDMERVGRSALLMSAGIATGLGLSVKAAVDWEQAWAGVTKTVDGSASELASLEEGLRSMARELPATHEEIAGVAEAAGQLGVGVNDIEKFTKVMVDLGETTNLSATEAATSLARFSNIMGTSADDVDRLGSTIVDLGNNSATTEAEIVEMGQRLAAAGKIAGLSEADVFAFASTLTSVGVNAEAGGTALSKVFTRINDAVIDGGDNLATFATVAGMSADEFARAYREDAAGAIATFITGLENMSAAGQSTSGVFKDLKLNDERLKRALLSTASAGSLLTDQLALAAKAWEENTALQTEAEKRYATTGSQLEILRNKVTDLGIDAGTVLLPALNSVVGAFGDMADGMSALPGPVTALSVGLAGVSAVGLGVVGVIGTLAPRIKEAKDALEKMGAGGKFAARNMGTFAKGVAGASAILALGAIAYSKITEKARKYDESVTQMTQSFDSVLSGQQALDDAFSDIFDKEFDPKLAVQLRELGISFDDIQAAASEGRSAMDVFNGVTKDQAAAANISEEALFDLAGSLKTFTERQQEAAEGSIARQVAAGDLTEADIDAAAAQLGLTDASENYVAVLALLAPEIEGAAEEVDVYTVAAEDAEQATEDFNNGLDALLSTMFGTEDAADALQSQMNALPGVLADAREEGLSLNNVLSDQSDAAIAVRGHMRDVAEQAINQIQVWKEQGASGAELDAKIRTLSSSLRQQAIDAGLPAPVVDHYLGVLAQIPTQKNTAINISVSGYYEAIAKLDAISRRNGTNVLFNASVRARERYGSRYGNIFSYAQGGVTPAHIMPGGPSILKYAEPETGGEAFIPRNGNRSRSLGILDTAAGWYGMNMMPKGSMVSASGGTVVNNNYVINAQGIGTQEIARKVRDAIVTLERTGV